MLPFLNSTKENSKKYVVSFQGLNLCESYADGELSACENISTVKFPSLTQRFGRTAEGAFGAPTAMHSKKGLVVIDGTTVKHNGKNVGTVTEGRKQMATIGNYVVIFPDKVAYNVETGEFEQMEAEYSVTEGEDGGYYNEIYVEWNEDGQYYEDESGNVFDGEVIATDSGYRGLVWVPDPRTMTFASDSITSGKKDAFPFKVGDAVTISGCASHPENNKTAIIRGVDGNRLTFYENTFTEGKETEPITIKREVPDLDFICESNYRLWGTKGNTIYGSKYGDPFNFQVFDGLTGDSYYIDVATDGPFTGCVPYSSHICFFKENTLHKLYGSKPSNFQLVTSQVYGVQKGSERSMVTINETLFYKGVNGVYAYTGGVPDLVSEKFGTKRFSDACAASDGERYYIAMQSGGEWGIYVYDVARNLWTREDGMRCVDMAAHDGHVYLLDAGGTLWKVDEAAEEQIGWSMTFCPFHETVNERKGYSKFHLRLELEAGAWLTAEMKRDTDTRWEKIYTTHNERARTVSIPVLPRRCASVQIRLTGKGKCVLRTFIREFFTGSDV